MEQPLIQSKENRSERRLSLLMSVVFWVVAIVFKIKSTDDANFLTTWLCFITFLVIGIGALFVYWRHFDIIFIYKNRLEIQKSGSLPRKIIHFDEILNISTRQMAKEDFDYEICTIETRSGEKFDLHETSVTLYRELLQHLLVFEKK